MSYNSCNLLLNEVYITVVPVGGATSQSEEAERKRIADEEAARTKAADEADRKVLFLLLLFSDIT